MYLIRVIYNYVLELTVCWFAIIFALCATPGNFVPSPTWADLLSIDKLVHVMMFFILCELILIVTLKYNVPNAMVIVAVSFAVAYGGVLEILQATCFVNRSGNWQDFVADVLGCLMAVFSFKKTKLLFFK